MSDQYKRMLLVSFIQVHRSKLVPREMLSLVNPATSWVLSWYIRHVAGPDMAFVKGIPLLPVCNDYVETFTPSMHFAVPNEPINVGEELEKEHITSRRQSWTQYAECTVSWLPGTFIV